MSDIILSCPFCGAKGVLEDGVHDETMNVIWQVKCGDNHGDQGCGVHPQTWWRDNKWEAIKDWNRRPDPHAESKDGHEDYEEDMK